MDKLLEHFGTQTALANFLNIKTGHVYYWRKNGIPPRRAIEIEEKTNGLFNRRLLCPEFFNQ
jgi:hypothetical protein